MMSITYSFDGLLVVALLLICTCAYLKRVPRVSSWLLSEKKGFFGVFYKASVVGVRLHSTVSACCVAAALYILFVRYMEFANYICKQFQVAQKSEVLKSPGDLVTLPKGTKQKVTLPKGTKKKVKKTPPKGPKRGRHVFIQPKNKNFVEQAKVSAEVTKTINEKNEEMVKDRADRDVGRLSNAAKKAAEKN
ncbi:unnamed protein product [Anisakis simplex]|uniref:Protein kish-B n=1 Tax=Anisakis simplex TaxID=6269 RepID=A0A0M3J4J1_ANISI|nr:unnamed protein product [Anisakis simplex]